MPDSQKSETAVVYHYTDVDTMMKIVDSACLWATSIKYLNDVKEYEHFRDLVRAILGTIQECVGDRFFTV